MAIFKKNEFLDMLNGYGDSSFALDGFRECNVTDAAWLFLTRMTREVLRITSSLYRKANGLVEETDRDAIDMAMESVTSLQSQAEKKTGEYIRLADKLCETYNFLGSHNNSMEAARLIAENVRKEFPQAVRWNAK